MKKLICILLCGLLALAVFAGCGARRTIPPVETDSVGGLPVSAFDSPRIYVLDDDDEEALFGLMPTVTLYENGNAKLSQPPISSAMPLENAVYSVEGDELIVSGRGDNGSMVKFTISDNGATLTIVSTNVSFSKKGSVYKYQPLSERIKNYDLHDGEPLTVDALRELAKKGGALTMEDFSSFEYRSPKEYSGFLFSSPEHYAEAIFDTEGAYTLFIWKPADTANLTCLVENNLTGERFFLDQEGSTGQVFDEYLGIVSIPKYSPVKWVDYLGAEELPWDSSEELSIPEYPGVTFTYTPGDVSADGKQLFGGMPVWNVYLADLTNDGKPELCATVSMGSGIVDTHVVVYDYAAKKLYTLEDRRAYDYFLFIDDGEALIGKGRLAITRTDYSGGSPVSILDDVSGVTIELRLVGGEILRP